MSGDALMKAVREGQTIEVTGLLDAMTDAERRACLPALKELRKELRSAPWSPGSRMAYPALHAAGAACHGGAAGAATWIAASDMRWSQASPGVLLHVLDDREPDWLGDLTHRLAERPVTSRIPYVLLAGLVKLSGGDVPTTDAYVEGWVEHIGSTWHHGGGGTVVERLRQEPHLAQMVAALFESVEVTGRVAWLFGDGPGSWFNALAQLAREGTLDRKLMVDACVARLLRGGNPADQRVFLRLLTCLDLTREEERERSADWTALASDATSTVAWHAQSVLAALALDGELTPRQLAEMSSGVLFRTEKKLVRAQLMLLGKVLRRHPSTASELLPAAAQAFGHEDTGLLEAADLVDRLDTYRRLEARPGQADFAQALLRVRRDDRVSAEAAAVRARELGTAEGERLAQWLTYEGPVLPLSRRRTSGVRILVELGELDETQPSFPPEFRVLGYPLTPFKEHQYCGHWVAVEARHWLGVLPGRRELVAARMLRDLSAVAVGEIRGGAALLPPLAEADGDAGEAVHLCLAYGLGARHPEDRLSAVDALLVLAARGQLDAGRLGADLGQLVRRGAVKPLRLAESIRTAAATGAYATVWAVLRDALPILLADLATEGTSTTPARGLGDLLAVAAECAERSGARGEFPHLSQAAGRRGSSKLVTQARRLRTALTQPAAA